MKKAILQFVEFLDENRIFVILLFFVIYLFAGLCLVNDYGLSFDESIQRVRGNEYYDLITGKDPVDMSAEGKAYGPFFAIILAFQEHLLNSTDSRAVYLSFHTTTFLFYFIGVVFFFLVGQKIFKNWKLSLLACTMLILSPRLFADSFYSPKDIPFLVMFLFSMYTLLLLSGKPNYLTAILHGVASAATIDIRIIGVMIPAVTTLVILYLLSTGEGVKRLRLLLVLGLYLASTFGFIVLFWPILYFDLSLFVQSIKTMSNFPFEEAFLYRGAYYHCTELFRNYLPTWIAITTPIPYLVLFILGGSVIIYRLIRNFTKPVWIKDHIAYPLVLYWFLVPFLYVIIQRPCIYNGWRHFYFIYPALVLMGVIGVEFLYSVICNSTVLHEIGKRIFFIALTVMLLASVTGVVYVIAVDHPNEFAYFNRLAGRNMAEIMTRYEVDYFGVAYRQALEYIAFNDPSPLIKILKTQTGVEKNAALLKIEDRRRITFCTANEDPDYLILPGAELPQEYAGASLFYSIDVTNGRIVSVYRLK
jgi:hypothetical protein